MVTVEAGLVIPLNSSNLGTTAIGFRRALALLFKQSSPGIPIAGRLGTNHLAVAGNNVGMSYIVSAGGIVLVRTPASGVYLVNSPVSVVVPTAIGDGSNPRIDRIYCKQPDPSLDGPTAAVDFVIDVSIGLAAATPTVPNIPSGAFELARKVVAPGATNTATGAAFTNVGAVTSLAIGGTVTAISEGGTGATTQAAARTNLGFTSGTTVPNNAVGNNGDIYFMTV